MLNNRLFKVFIAIALAITLTFTVREAFATSLLRAEGNAVTTCASLPSRYSIHTVYNEESAMSLPYTEDDPTGVDGGLIYLLSNYRICSK